MPETSQPMIENGQSQFRRVMMLVGIGYLFFVFSDPQDGIMALTIKVILKDQLHLEPTKIASFFGSSLFPVGRGGLTGGG